MSIFFFCPACFRAFSDATHSRFLCVDPKLCLHGSLKMLVLALPQIYTSVFNLWKSIDLDSAWLRYSFPCPFFFCPACFRAFSDATHSRFLCVDAKLCLHGSLKMLVLALPQIYTSVFNLWKSIDLESAWLRYSFPCPFFFLSRVFSRV